MNPHRLTLPSELEKPLRRAQLPRGNPLTMSDIRGEWHPSGSVAGAGVFAVVWSTRAAKVWAPLHDFTTGAQMQLIEACRQQDPATGSSLPWPKGRCCE